MDNNTKNTNSTVNFITEPNKAHYALIDGRLYECRVKGLSYSFKDANGSYSVEAEGAVRDVDIETAVFYESIEAYKKQVRLTNKANTLLNLASDLIIPNRCYGDSHTLYRIVDGAIQTINVDDLNVVELGVAGEGEYAWFYVKSIDGIAAKTCYGSVDDALVYNSLSLTKMDGTIEKQDGLGRRLLLSEKQKKAADKFAAALKALEKEGIGIVFDNDRWDWYLVNNDKDIIISDYIEDYGYEESETTDLFNDPNNPLFRFDFSTIASGYERIRFAMKKEEGK